MLVYPGLVGLMVTQIFATCMWSLENQLLKPSLQDFYRWFIQVWLVNGHVDCCYVYLEPREFVMFGTNYVLFVDLELEQRGWLALGS